MENGGFFTRGGKKGKKERREREKRGEAFHPGQNFQGIRGLRGERFLQSRGVVGKGGWVEKKTGENLRSFRSKTRNRQR